MSRVPISSSRPGHPPAVGASTSTKTLRPDIQALRGLAVLMVVLFHADGLLPGGYIGVDVFFVISGFLIGRMLYDEYVDTSRIDLRRFFTRRARRLLPALAVTTSVTLLVSLIVMPIGGVIRALTETAAAASLYAANAQLHIADDYFAPAAEQNPFLHTWSLSVEEQFYLIFPLAIAALAFVAARRMIGPERRGRWLIIMLVAGSAGSLALNLVMVHLEPSLIPISKQGRFAFYAPLTRAWQFGVGALAAIALTSSAVRGRAARHSGWLAWAGLITITFAAIAYDATTTFPGIAATLPVMGATALLVAGTTPRDASPMRWITTRPLVRIGDLSYSWYLWHWPIIVWTMAIWPTTTIGPLIAGAVSLLPAAASYRWVEARWRHDPTIEGRRVIVLVVAAMLVPLAVAGFTRAANAQINEAWGLADEVNLGRVNGCHFDPDDHRGWPHEACFFDFHGPEAPTILLIGDSHADSLSGGVAEAAQTLGANFAVWTWSGRPFLGDGSFEPPHGEVNTTASSFDLIDRLQPDVIVVTNRSTQALDDPTAWARGAGRDESTRIERWTADMNSAISALDRRGIPSVWTAVVPEFDVHYGPSLVRRGGSTQVRAVEDVEAQRSRIVDAEREVASRWPNVATFDPVPTLCTQVCTTIADGVVLYRDEHHLTSAASKSLAPSLSEVLATLLPQQ